MQNYERLPLVGSSTVTSASTKSPLDGFLLQALYFILLAAHTALWVIRQIRYAILRLFVFPHRSPQLVRSDVRGLAKVPRHVAVVLRGSPDELASYTADIAAWCLGAGSECLTVFVREDKLNATDVAAALEENMPSWFGTDAPVISIRQNDKEIIAAPAKASSTNSPAPVPAPAVLRIFLVALRDGRDAIVTQAQDYSEQVKDGSLEPASLTVDKINKDLQRRYGGEPDLLVCFDSRLDLAGVSPWHIRVTELFYLPDNEGVVSYHVFWAALRKFSRVKINLGS